MKAIVILFAFAMSLGPANGQGIVARISEAPHRHLSILYYDDTFLFVSRHHGDERDSGGGTEPGLFVHSKERDQWIQVLQISTQGGTFGKSWSPKEEERQKLARISVSWDFTGLTNQTFAEIPLRTSRSIAFPDKIERLKDARYRLSFMTQTGVPGAETHLFMSQADLMKAFAKGGER